MKVKSVLKESVVLVMTVRSLDVQKDNVVDQMDVRKILVWVSTVETQASVVKGSVSSLVLRSAVLRLLHVLMAYVKTQGVHLLDVMGTMRCVSIVCVYPTLVRCSLVTPLRSVI